MVFHRSQSFAPESVMTSNIPTVVRCEEHNESGRKHSDSRSEHNDSYGACYDEHICGEIAYTLFSPFRGNYILATAAGNTPIVVENTMTV